MSINSLNANNAYRNQLKLAQEAAEAPLQENNKASFSDLIKEAVGAAEKTQYQAEAIQMESLTGKVELTDLVTAITNAELSLNTVVAVRDRVINAYQDIIKMPI